MRHLILLRGINVGGKNKLPMADLRAALEGLGAGDVQTWIQSGNAVFDAPARLARGLAVPRRGPRPPAARDALSRGDDMKFAAVLGLSFALFAGAALAQPPAAGPPPGVELPAHAERILRDYEQAWRAKDAGALAGLFTADGWVLSSGRPPVQGHEDIRARYANSGGPLVLRGFHYEEQGDLAVLLGGYAREAGQPDAGKFTLVLRRTPDGWRILSDMDNGNAR